MTIGLEYMGRLSKQQERLQAQRKRISAQKIRRETEKQRWREGERALGTRGRGEAVSGMDKLDREKLSKQSRWKGKWDRRAAKWEARARKFEK